MATGRSVALSGRRELRNARQGAATVKLSTRSTYGVRMMVHLTGTFGRGPLLLKEIAEKEGISEKYLSQIVIPLRSAGLVRSVRGAHGGYIVGRAPVDITLRDVVEVLEGGLDIVDGEESANTGGTIRRVVGRIWQGLGQELAASLGAITLADIERRVREDGQATTMYNI